MATETAKGEAAEEAERSVRLVEEVPDTWRLAEDVALVTVELGLNGGMPLAHLVAAANTAMGLEGEGPLAAQVQTLLTELGVSVEPNAA